MRIEENTLIYRAAMFGYKAAPDDGFVFLRRVLVFAVLFGLYSPVFAFAFLVAQGYVWNEVFALGVAWKDDLTSLLACFGIGVLSALIEIPLIIGMYRGMKHFCESIELPDGEGAPEDKVDA